MSSGHIYGAFPEGTRHLTAKEAEELFTEQQIGKLYKIEHEPRFFLLLEKREGLVVYGLVTGVGEYSFCSMQFASLWKNMDGPIGYLPNFAEVKRRK